MKVILKQAVPKLGKEGQVVNVKDGFARNYLFPQGMAIVADKAQLKVQERRDAKVTAQLADTKAAAEVVKAKLDGAIVKIPAKVGKDSAKLFGAITSQDIADAIKAQLGETMEKKAVLLLQPIKQLGRYSIELDIHRQVDIKIVVSVFDAEHPEEEPAAEEVEAEPEPEAVEA